MKEELYNDNLGRKLKEAAEDFQMQPSPEVWMGIENKIHPRRRRRYILWWSAAGILLLAGLGTYFIWQHQKPGTSQITSKKNVIRNHTNTTQTLSREEKPQPAPEKPQNVNRQTTFLQQNHSELSDEEQPASKGNMQHELLTITSKVDGNNGYDLPLLEKTQSTFNFSTDLTEKRILPLSPESTIITKRNKSLIAQKQPSESMPEKKNPGQEKKEYPNISWELSFTPGMSYRVLKVGKPGMNNGSPSFNTPANPGNNVNPPSLSDNLNTERSSGHKSLKQHPGWGWEAGARLSLHLKKSWQLQTGLSIARTGYSILAYGAFPTYVQSNGRATSPVNNYSNSWFMVTAAAAPAPESEYLHNQYLTAEIPLLLGKQFGQPEKTSFVIRGGAGLSYMINSNSIMYAPESGRYFTDKSYLKTFNSNLHLEMIFQIPLNKKLHFSFGPSFQYQLFSTYKNFPQVKEHPYLLGIKTGLQWRK